MTYVALNAVPLDRASSPLRVLDGAMPIDRAALLAQLNVRPIVMDQGFSNVLKAPQGGESPAIAWLSNWRIDVNGSLWADRVEFTPWGQRAVQDKTLRWLSPAVAVNASGAIRALASVSLLRSPDTDLVAMNRAENAREVLSPAELEMARRMGITPEAWARGY
jgi:phage I-like protein